MVSKLARFFSVAALLLLLAGWASAEAETAPAAPQMPVQAMPVAGADDARFVLARDHWLEGDNERALPLLAELAAANNRAAQVFLGVFARGAKGPWVDSLPEPERRALLRAPGGSFGRSWLVVAAEAGDPLAEAVMALVDRDADEDTVRDLARIGEPLAAAKLAVIIQVRTGEYPEQAVADLWRQGLFPGIFALHFAMPILLDSDRAEISRLQREAAFPFDAILASGLAREVNGSEWVDVISAWYDEANSSPDQRRFFAQGFYDAPPHPHLMTARMACDQACGASTDEAMICYGAFAHALSSEFPYLGITTPSELLVPQARYAGSKRAVGQLSRQVEGIPAVRQSLKAGQAVAGACMSDLISGE